MARPDMRGNEPGKAQDTVIPPEVASQAADLVAGRAREEERPRRFGASRVLTAADRDRILKDARSVEFPAALRGYDRTAVDRYVERINRLITELEMSSSPEAAIRHALAEVSEETRDILQRAHETAEDITARSRAKADDRVQQAESESQEIRVTAERKAAETRDAAQQEAAQLREAAERETGELRETTQRDVAELREMTQREVSELRETAAREVKEQRDSAASEAAETREAAARESQRMRTVAQREAEEARETARREAEEMLESADTRARELARSAEAIWRERRRLIEDMRAVSEQLQAIGETEGKRFPRFGEEGTVAAELLREPSATVAAGLVKGEQTNGSPEVVPG
jgi:DivIVA domain-containing protein